MVTNFAHNLGGEDGISAGDGCLHVVVAFLSALSKIAEIIPVLGSRLSRWDRWAIVEVKDKAADSHVVNLIF